MRALGAIIFYDHLCSHAAARTHAEALRVKVFTTERHPMVPDLARAEVYHLDGPATIEDELSATLPQDREKAASSPAGRYHKSIATTQSTHTRDSSG